MLSLGSFEVPRGVEPSMAELTTGSGFVIGRHDWQVFHLIWLFQERLCQTLGGFKRANDAVPRWSRLSALAVTVLFARSLRGRWERAQDTICR